MTKARKTANHLIFLLNLKKEWDYRTKDNSGYYTNKIILHTTSGPKIINKEQLDLFIKYAKNNLRKYL